MGSERAQTKGDVPCVDSLGQGGLDARSIYKAARIVIGLDNLGFPVSLILHIVRILSCKEITPVAPSTAACLTYPPPHR